MTKKTLNNDSQLIMKKIPLILMYSRLIFGFVMLFLAWLKPDLFKSLITALIVFGLLTDIFDGIIARKLNISTQKLEIMVVLLILKEWTNDVPGIYHAILLRQGKTIKRNKLFNG